MKKPSRSILIHPFLFTFYAVLAPLANNIGTVGFQAIQSLFTSLLAVILLTVLFKFLFKNPEKSSLLITGLVIAYFSFGTLESILNNLTHEWSGSSVAAAIIILALLAVWIFALSKWIKHYTTLTNYFNLLSLILLVFPLYTIFTYRTQSSKYDQVANDYQAKVIQVNHLDSIPTGTAPAGGENRDIYYIILDSYTRADVLKNLYGYDNSEFITQLQQRGFYVAEASNANYSHTIYSMASSLNMLQVNDLPGYLHGQWNAPVTTEGPLQGTLTILMQHNRVMSFLKEQGYQTVAYDNGYVKITSADIYVKSPEIDEFNAAAAFDIMLADTTLGKFFQNKQGANYQQLESMFDDHRQRILFTLADLPKYAAKDGDYFIYAHIIAPHSPYVFGPNGEERRGVTRFTLENEDTQDWSFDMYRDQVIYINKLVLQTIDQILATSKTPPIIIIQGDHSTNSHLLADSPIPEQMQVAFPILNAYLLPGVDTEKVLYPAITPVNSFRQVFNTYFGTQIDLLPDEIYYTAEKNGEMQFLDACQEYQYCP